MTTAWTNQPNIAFQLPLVIEYIAKIKNAPDAINDTIMFQDKQISAIAKERAFSPLPT